MKAYLFDTTVVIAASVQAHPHHLKALPWLVAVKKKRVQGWLSAHALAELYAVLTRLPVKPILSSAFVQRFIDDEIIPAFDLIDLSVKDYRLMIEHAANLSLKGGVFYDCLHWQAAKKKNLQGLVTLNSTDFLRIADESGPAIINPCEASP